LSGIRIQGRAPEKNDPNQEKQTDAYNADWQNLRRSAIFVLI